MKAKGPMRFVTISSGQLDQGLLGSASYRLLTHRGLVLCWLRKGLGRVFASLKDSIVQILTIARLQRFSFD